jgi:hypothetical protein
MVDEEFSKLVDRRNQVKLQWLQDPGAVNDDDVSSERREGSRHFRKRKRKYLKYKINELESETCIGA